MGNSVTTPTVFPDQPEIELYKLYFSTSLVKNISSLDLFINFEQLGVTSIVYDIQFINDNKVVEQVSIVCRYHIKQKKILGAEITLHKNIPDNLETNDDFFYMAQTGKIGFPHEPVYLNNNGILQFIRTENDNYVISIIEDGYQNKSHHRKSRIIGVLDFKTKTNDKTFVEPIVQTTVRVHSKIKNKLFPIDFKLDPPIANTQQVAFNLTHFSHRTIHREKKKHIIKLPVNIRIDQHFTNVHSYYPNPMIKCKIVFNFNQYWFFDQETMGLED